jgi:hypothetical protein
LPILISGVATGGNMKNIKITTPEEHRAILLAAMEALLEGRLNVQMANALSSISAEVHKNLKQEWDMRVYASENLTLSHGQVIKMIEAPDDSRAD